MATKISGIKGINISKSSVLKDGSKKTSMNEGYRDTSNGTTRDSSNDRAASDAAMIKTLLGNSEYMAKKTAQIEQQMKMAATREADRQKREEYYWRKRLENDAKQEERESEKNFDKYYNKIDNGVVNGVLATFLGPAGVMLGKGLNKMGVPLEDWGKKGLRYGGRAIGRGVKKVFSPLGGLWGKKNDDQNENALDVNRKEEAAQPVNKLRTSVTERLD